MKKIGIPALLMLVALMTVSCHDNNDDPTEYDDYRMFIGTWGLKQIDYYFVDYFGQPIEEERETYYFTPGDTLDGIDLVFRSDKTGLRIDRSHDTLFKLVEVDPVTYDTLFCQDTILYSSFTYSYDVEEKTLYLSYPDNGKTYAAKVLAFDNQGFRYYNQYKLYGNDYAEDALLERISQTPSRTASTRRKIVVPRKPGSFLFNQ